MSDTSHHEMPTSHYEIVETEAGYHCRLIAGNGLTVMSSEVYHDSRDAVRAVEIALEAAGYRTQKMMGIHFHTISAVQGVGATARVIRVEKVNERTQ